MEGRREAKKRAIRAAVRDAALRLAVRDGVEHVTIERIADEADIALRTFFNHFSSKEEAVMATASAGAEALVARFRARPRTESVLEALREAVLLVLDQDEPSSRDLVASFRLLRRSPSLVPQQLAVLAAQEKNLAAAIAERAGLAAGPVYPAICAAAALSALRVVLDRWLDQAAAAGEPPDPPSMAALRAGTDEAISELAAGLDRPGA